MPPPPRKDNAVQRAQDKEAKRARGALSCAECRRLKLKCDKTVPCSSCRRRGCEAICPNGSLITGQGTRFVLADTQKLHQKIAQMSDRIRQLEDALALLQSSQSHEPHPLLDRESLKIKSSIELHSAVQGEEGLAELSEDADDSQVLDSMGTLAIHDDGAATFYGRSAGHESILIGEPVSSPPQARSTVEQIWEIRLPTAITDLSTSFPLTSAPPGIDLDYLQTFLPPWHEAQRLTGLYLDSAPWFFGPVTRRQLQEETLPMWYDEVPRANPDNSHNSPSTGSSPGGQDVGFVNTPARGKGAHDLALLFMIFCFGSLTDVNLPAAPENPLSEKYYNLTRAALGLEPVLERPPSVATVQTLALMAIYEGLRSGENSIESTWAMMGLATKLAQSIGLHRDSARWRLTPAEVQKRRALFWELFITDGWQSLATGRLVTFSLPFVDCELPEDPDQRISNDGTIMPSFPYWKARFGAECVAHVISGTLTSRAPKYSIIKGLDNRIRNMDFPQYAEGPHPENAGLSETMSHFMPTNYKHLTLLYIHRCYFTYAIQSNPSDPMKGPYGASFLAGYRSACELLGSIKVQFSLFPAQVARFWVLWTHAFSSTIMIASLVIHGSQCKYAPAALLELSGATDLFERAARHGGRAVKFLPIVKRLREKAQKVYYNTVNGVPPPVTNDIFRASASDAKGDEMSIFSGKTYTLTKSTTPARSSRSPEESNSRSVSDSPPSVHPAAYPSFADVHPKLLEELNHFDGNINAQIENAYRSNHETFNQTLMGQQAQFPASAGPASRQPQREPQQEPSSFRPTPMQGVQQSHAEPYQPSQQYPLSHHQQPQLQPGIQHHTPPEQTYRPAMQDGPSNASLGGGHLQQHPQSQPRVDQPSTQPYAPSYPSVSPVEQYPQPPQASRPGPSLQYSHPQSNLRQETYTDSSQAQYYAQRQALQTMPPHPPPPTEYMQRRHSQQYEVHSPAQLNSASSSSSSSSSMRPGPIQYPTPESVLTEPIPRQYWNEVAAPHPGHVAQPHPQREELVYHSQQQHEQRYFQPHQQYTPESALRGIAADDRGLQESWQNYMLQVGSPRKLLED